jgi:type 1 glutamine amidotransferase
MKSSLLPAVLLALLAAMFLNPDASAAGASVLIVVGPSNHPPGSHEVAAGGRLVKHCLENMANVPDVKAIVVQEWPKDDAVLDAARTVIFIGDTFPLQRMPDAQANLAKLGAMMKRGCGIVCVHYATGLRAEDVAADGAHPLLQWLGGYFATKCVHHQSIAKIYPAATITPAAPAHPVSRGWREFTLNDEPYINNYFGGEGNSLLPGVTVLATSMLPPDAPRNERVAWCVERPDGGRGFGIVMPHFYRNWKLEDLRRFILNGIVWTAKLDVPADGVRTAPPDLAAFAPAAVEPLPPKPKPAAAADSAAELAKKIVAAHGGPDKLLRTFRFSETYQLAGRDKAVDRTSTLQPPNLWYVGNRERVSQENKGGVCHDVWMWTLCPLVDAKTKLELLPDASVEGKAARVLRVSGSIEPAMNVLFDAATHDLLKIEWKGEQFFFSAPIEVDGTRLPSKCSLIGKTGKERMRTELKKIERLSALPANLPKPDHSKSSN